MNMFVYAVIPFKDISFEDTDFTTTLEELDVYDGKVPKVWFVNYGGTSKELADFLGFSPAGERDGIVIAVDYNFYGFTNKNLWTWIQSREST